MLQGQRVHPLPWFVTFSKLKILLKVNMTNDNKFKHLYQLIFGSGA